MSIHLTRNVCDGCAVWCHFDRDNIGDTCEVDKDRVDHYADGFTSNPAEATCAQCLLTASRYGAACSDRVEHLATEFLKRKHASDRAYLTWSESGEQSWPLKDGGK